MKCRSAMRVSEVMTRDVRVCNPGQSIRDCAKAMVAFDVGILPVAENNALVGMITDRDIAIRAIAGGKGPDTPVRGILSREVLYCFEDQELEHVANSMGMARVRRVPVLARDHSVVGILSLADVARCSPGIAAHALRTVSKRGGPHSQKASARQAA